QGWVNRTCQGSPWTRQRRKIGLDNRQGAVFPSPLQRAMTHDPREPVMKHVLARRLLLGASTLALGLTGVLVSPNVASAAGETAVFTKVQDWGTGWEGKYTITAGSTAITSWRVEF